MKKITIALFAAALVFCLGLCACGGSSSQSAASASASGSGSASASAASASASAASASASAASAEASSAASAAASESASSASSAEDIYEKAINACLETVEGYNGGAENIHVKAKISADGTQEIEVLFDYDGKSYDFDYNPNTGEVTEK